MKFPNKIFELKETVIFDSIVILEELEDDMSVLDLYKICKTKCNGIQEFFEALDVLYAIGRIDYNYESRRFVNVK